jgi:hypothetical protein
MSEPTPQRSLARHGCGCPAPSCPSGIVGDGIGRTTGSSPKNLSAVVIPLTREQAWTLYCSTGHTRASRASR